MLGMDTAIKHLLRLKSSHHRNARCRQCVRHKRHITSYSVQAEPPKHWHRALYPRARGVNDFDTPPSRRSYVYRGVDVRETRHLHVSGEATPTCQPTLHGVRLTLALTPSSRACTPSNLNTARTFVKVAPAQSLPWRALRRYLLRILEKIGKTGRWGPHSRTAVRQNHPKLNALLYNNSDLP